MQAPPTVTGGGRTAASLAQLAPIALSDLILSPPDRKVAGPLAAVAVEPRVMQLLVALAQAPGQVVGRDVLIEHCWPGMTVGDDALHRAVAGARRALAESGAAARIETIPRTGYRLEAVSAPAPKGVHGESEGTKSGDRFNRRALLAGIAVVAASAGTGLWLNQRRSAEVQALLDQAERALRQAQPAADAQGIGFLKRAVALGPNDAEAWGRLAMALRATAEFSPPPKVAALLADSRAAAVRALGLDADQPEAEVAQLSLVPVFGNWLRLEQGLRRILENNPRNLAALDALSQVLAGAGLVRTHYPMRLRTMELDPLHAAYNFRSIYAHWMNGRIPEADRAGERGLEIWPRHFATWGARASVFAFTGRPERTLAMLADTETKPPLPPPVELTLAATARALVSGTTGDRSQAMATIDGAVRLGGPVLAVTGGMAFAALGATSQALDLIEAFLLERGPVAVHTSWRSGQALHNDVRRRFTNFMFLPVMAQLWREPRFDSIVRDIGLVDYWKRSGNRPEYRDTPAAR